MNKLPNLDSKQAESQCLEVELVNSTFRLIGFSGVAKFLYANLFWLDLLREILKEKPSYTIRIVTSSKVPPFVIKLLDDDPTPWNATSLALLLGHLESDHFKTFCSIKEFDSKAALSIIP